MKSFARLSGLVAALCLGVPATGFSHGHSHGGSCSHGGGSWHGSSHCGSNHGWRGGSFCGSRFFYGSYFPSLYYSSYSSPYYYDTSYYDASYDSPSFGISVSSSPYTSYRGTRVNDQGDNLAVDVQRALRARWLLSRQHRWRHRLWHSGGDSAVSIRPSARSHRAGRSFAAALPRLDLIQSSSPATAN